MSGGSTEPESPHDRECPNCGLYYQDKGVSFDMHTASCSGGDGNTTAEGSSPSGAPDVAPQGGDGGSDGPGGDDPTMGNGPPQTSSNKVELGCGHESIDPDEYSVGTIVECETCGQRFKVTGS